MLEQLSSTFRVERERYLCLPITDVQKFVQVTKYELCILESCQHLSLEILVLENHIIVIMYNFCAIRHKSEEQMNFHSIQNCSKHNTFSCDLRMHMSKSLLKWLESLMNHTTNLPDRSDKIELL